MGAIPLPRDGEEPRRSFAKMRGRPHSIADIEADWPHCEICGAAIAQKQGERPAKWRKRQTCCADHARILQGLRARDTKAGLSLQGYEHPPCIICGGPIEQRPTDKLADWKRRRTCSPECMAANRSAAAYKGVLTKADDLGRSSASRRYSRPARKATPTTRFETVAEALARGIKIIRYETPVYPPAGVPVRPSAGYIRRGM